MVWKVLRLSLYFFLCVIITITVWSIIVTMKDTTAMVESEVFFRQVLPKNKTESTCPSSFFLKPTLNYQRLQNLSIGRSVRFKLDPMKDYTEKVVIMTPISNTENHLANYFNNICRLTYPHHLISIALLEDSSHDNTYRMAKNSLEMLQNYFDKVSLHKSKDSLPYRQPFSKHEVGWQYMRRRHLAKSRNLLLSLGLVNETWVLWMDSDVQYIPPDIIQQLLAAEKDIVVPSCMFKSGKKIDVYDKNTWKDTDTSKKFLQGKGNEFLMLEGYGPSMRYHLNRLKTKGNVVEIDGVGGCVLLIKADLHRKGLVFPPYTYKNHIETEGLAKMAQDMGLKIYGLPNIEVFHE